MKCPKCGTEMTEVDHWAGKQYLECSNCDHWENVKPVDVPEREWPYNDDSIPCDC